MKKGGKAKKCSCGCDLITIKEDGGKLTSKCSCNCKGGKMKKHQEGGLIQKSQKGSTIKYDPKKPYSKTNYDGGYNKELEGLKGSAIDSLQRYNNLPNKAQASESGTDKRKAKEILKDLRSGKSQLKAKGGIVKKKQEGGDVVSSQSQVGVAKNGVKLGVKQLKKEELKNAEVANPKVTPMQKSLKNKKDITKVMDKETLKRLKSKVKK